MKRGFKALTILYFAIGLLLYLSVRWFAGGLGIFSFGGPAGDALEFAITVLVWPFVVVLSVLVVMQGR